MRNLQYFREKRPSFLPNPSQCNDQNLFEKIQNASKQLEMSDDASFEREIVDLLLAKIQGSLNTPWKKKDYAKFWQSISKLSNKQLNVVEDSIFKCLLASDEEILRNLERFANQVDYYPEVERTYLRKEKRYLIQEKEIDVMDCFFVICLLFAQMRSYNCAKAKALFDSAEDFSNLYGMIQEIANSSDQKQKNSILEDFDQSFAWIQEFSLFCDLYENYRNVYFADLLSCLYDLYAIQCERENYERDRAIRSYQTDSIRNREKKLGSISYDNWRKRNRR